MKKIKANLIIFLYFPLLLFSLLESMLFYEYFEVFFYVNTLTFLFSLILFYIFYLLLFSIVKNSKYSFLITSIIGYIIMLCSTIKIAFSGEPLYIYDFLYLGNTGEIFDLINGSIWITIKPLVFTSLSILLFIILLNYFSFKYNYKLENNIKRYITIGICSILILIMFIPSRKVDLFILDKIYKVNNRDNYGAKINNLEYYYYYGHFAGIYYSLLDSRFFPRDDYDEELIDSIMDSVNDEEDKSFGKPNIIVVFSESFWDVDQLDEVKFDKPVTSNFNRLKDKGLFFNMITPSHGGNSANVEFEFLTGGSLNYFGIGVVPYMSIYKTDKRYNSPSIIKELKNNDYHTKIVIYNSPNLFNCSRFYKYVQPDEVEYRTDISDEYIKGRYVSDEYVFNSIMDEFNNKGDDKLFYFVTTMQAHMPYLKDKYDEYDINIVKSNLSKDDNDAFRSYAQGIYDNDKQLGILYDYIQTLDEDTLLIFFGDHLPIVLSSDYNDVLEKLDYFNTDDKLLNIFRMYNTQALVLANFDISNLKNNNDIKYLGPDLLSSYVLNHMDIELSPYYKWLYSTKDIIGASNRYISINPNGELFYTSNLDDEMDKLNNLRNNIQYKYFIK